MGSQHSGCDVPLGTTEEDNVERWTLGRRRDSSISQPKSHADLGEQLGIYDPPKPPFACPEHGSTP